MAQVAIGYTLSSEEQAPVDLVKNAQNRPNKSALTLGIHPWEIMVRDA